MDSSRSGLDIGFLGVVTLFGTRSLGSSSHNSAFRAFRDRDLF